MIIVSLKKMHNIRLFLNDKQEVSIGLFLDESLNYLSKSMYFQDNYLRTSYSQVCFMNPHFFMLR